MSIPLTGRSMMMRENHKYEGYTYEPRLVEKSDRAAHWRIDHWVACRVWAANKDSEEIHKTRVDWDAYSFMTDQEFALWIELGRPRRTGVAPLNADDLMQLATDELVNLRRNAN